MGVTEGICGAQVGTGGHTLYGGFGYFGRIGGLLLDTVVEAEVVLADGSLVVASNTSYPDLFWVCGVYINAISR